jgi:hypothetical protein
MAKPNEQNEITAKGMIVFLKTFLRSPVTI